MMPRRRIHKVARLFLVSLCLLLTDLPLNMQELYLRFFALMFSLHCFTCCCALRKANLTTDEYALLAFKSSLNLDLHHPLSKNWSSSSSICSWVGVTCDARHKRVRSLNLHNMDFSGIISPQLGNLSFLVELDLSSNNFHGKLPYEFAKLRRLKLFNLSFNGFNGEIPNWIGELSKLQHLIFNNNSFGGFIPSSISNLSKLETLALNVNLINGTIPPEIGRLPCLKTLAIPANKLSGIIPRTISNISSLEVFNLFDNSLSGDIPPEIGVLPQLKIMYLGYNQLSGSIPMTIFNNSMLQEIDLERCNLSGSLPSCISCGLPRLEALYLTDNKLSGQIPSDIGNLTILQILYLANNKLEGSIPKEIGDLDKLEELAFGFNNLRGSVPMNIFNISTLTYLYLPVNSLSGFLPSDIGHNLLNLEELHLYGNKFSGKIPSSISNASELTEIELQDNKFSGVIPKAIGKLRYLQWLDVSINNFVSNTHEVISFLKNCKYLDYLDISLNPLHGKLPKAIGNLSDSLQVFMADSSNTDGSIPIEIGNLSSLFKLSLSGNNLNGPLPFTISRLHDLQYLDLGDNGLQGSIIDEICQIKSLSGLGLANNKFFGLMPTCLRNLTSLRYLDLSSNKFISEIPTSLWSLTDILELNLSSNTFTGIVPLDIGNLEALTLLDLSRNQISGNIPTSIGGLQTLQSLSLAHNELKGSIPESLGYLVSLVSLDLSQNYLSGGIPKSLQSLGYLKYINLSYNLLQGEIPDGGPFKNFVAESFTFNKALCGKPRLQVPPCREIKSRSRSPAKLIFIKCILPIFVSTVLVVSCVIILRCKRKKEGDHPAERDLWDFLIPRRISYFELVQATNGFDESNMLGRGSVGSVFKGILSSGLTVAIKVFNLDSEATSRSFDIECDAMRNLRHRNLVKVISCCSNIDIKSLVMEFMPNGSLEKWLYSHNYCLDFLQRLNIMIDVASALEYLHNGFSKPVVHCDIKPSNVLLDEDMVAHVSDFGVAKLLDNGQSKTHTETLATLGYIAPEYGTKGIVSAKADVYSFGIMLIEVFTRKKPTDDMFIEGLSLKSWVTESIPQAITQVMDSNLLQGEGHHIGDITRSILLILELALNCCTDLPEMRINMTDVAASLNKINIMFMQR